MELKELWSYIDAKRAVNTTRERLVEYEAVIYNPGTIRAAGEPAEHSNDSPDRFGIIADTHEVLLREWYQTRLRAAAAFKLLHSFEQALTSEEDEVFKIKYFDGKSQNEMLKELHRSESTLKRINKRIKEKFRKYES